MVQCDDSQTKLPQTIVAMITGNMARAGYPSRVTDRQSSPKTHEMGLRTDSVIMADHVATVLESEIDGTIGCCLDMTPVDEALRHTFGLYTARDNV